MKCLIVCEPVDLLMMFRLSLSAFDKLMYSIRVMIIHCMGIALTLSKTRVADNVDRYGMNPRSLSEQMYVTFEVISPCASNVPT